MLTLSIPDMHCNACKASVERTLLPLMSGAKLVVDLEHRRAMVEGDADTSAMIEALGRIGFPAEAVPA